MADSTPGPWMVDEDLEVWGPGATAIGRVYGADSFPCVDEDDADMVEAEGRANADLMAAAPAMADVLEAVEWLQTAEGEWCPSCRWGRTVGHLPSCALHAALVAAGRRA